MTLSANDVTIERASVNHIAAPKYQFETPSKQNNHETKAHSLMSRPYSLLEVIPSRFSSGHTSDVWWKQSHERSFFHKSWKMPYLKPSAKINSDWQMSSIWHFPWHGCHFTPFLIYYTFFHIKTYIKYLKIWMHLLCNENIYVWKGGLDLASKLHAKKQIKKPYFMSHILWVINYDSFRSPFCSIQINWGFTSDSLTPN